MEIDERTWKVIQKRLRYTDEEMADFKQNPKNADILSKRTEFADTILVVEVVEASSGCNSRHKAGDTFYFDAAGNLLVNRCKKNICVHVLSAAATLIYAANELMYAGVDPNEMRFNRASCIDVGLACGGWGRVVIELRAEEKRNS
jgi:uncharacterized repeat protein (TIGR04076 family)